MFRANFDWQPPSVRQVIYDVDFPPNFLSCTSSLTDQVNFQKQRLDEDFLVQNSTSANYVTMNLQRTTIFNLQSSKMLATTIAFWAHSSKTVVLKNVEVELFSRQNCQSVRKIVHDKNPEVRPASSGNGVEYTTAVDISALDDSLSVSDIWRVRVIFNFHVEKNPKGTVTRVLGAMTSTPALADKSTSCDHFKDLFGTATYTDFILVSADERQFPVHKIILARASEFFKAAFDGDFKEKEQGRMAFPANSSTVQSLLRWIYTKTLEDSDTNTVTKLMDLVEVADYCRVVVLKDLAHCKILSDVNFHNAVQIFRFAKERHGGEDMVKAALDVIKKEKKQIFMSMEEMRAFQEKFQIPDLD